MAHSNRKAVLLSLLTIEVLLFLAAIGTAYLAEEGKWLTFFAISAVTVVVFVLLRVVEIWPKLQELTIREDLAARMASTALLQGIRRYYNMQAPSEQNDRNSDTQRDISTATHMWLCANSGASYLDPSLYRHWPTIEKRLKEGAEFRVVLLDPYSAEKGFRNTMNVGGENFDSKVNIASLIKLYNTHQSLDIRFVRYGMHATVFVADNALYFDPYHVGVLDSRIENRSFCLRIEPATPEHGVGLFRLFKSHVESLWRGGKSFEEWIKASEDMLPPKLPALHKRQHTE